jgi:hypothetical protein
MSRRALPWAELRRGESFVFPPARSLRLTQRQAAARAAYQKSKHGRSFVVRTITEYGERVVRIRRIV